MFGKTGEMISIQNNVITSVPLVDVSQGIQKVDVTQSYDTAKLTAAKKANSRIIY